MTTLTIHNVDDDMERSLRIYAQQNGRSIEEEIKEILHQALISKQTEPSFGDRLRARFEASAVDELPIPSRSLSRLVIREH